jgi:hypothetical protein
MAMAMAMARARLQMILPFRRAYLPLSEALNFLRIHKLNPKKPFKEGQNFLKIQTRTDFEVFSTSPCRRFLFWIAEKNRSTIWSMLDTNHLS